MGAWDRLGLAPELPPASDTKKEDDGAATAPPTIPYNTHRSAVAAAAPAAPKDKAV